jgi:hypothetical protein
MFILLVLMIIFFFLENGQPEHFFKYKKNVFSFLIATIEAFFGLALLKSIPDYSSEHYSGVAFILLFIMNGLTAYAGVSIINDHLFFGTGIWWTFCLGIVLGYIYRGCHPIPIVTATATATATVPPQKEN